MEDQQSFQAETSGHQSEESANERKIAELTRANGILKANISTLYRTARAEISRKNDRIAELQSELDDLIFKRMNRRNNEQQESNKKQGEIQG